MGRGRVREALERGEEETAHSHKETQQVRHKDSPSYCRMVACQEAEGRGKSNRDNSTAWSGIFRRKRGRGIISLREEQRAFWERANKKQ